MFKQSPYGYEVHSGRVLVIHFDCRAPFLLDLMPVILVQLQPFVCVTTLHLDRSLRFPASDVARRTSPAFEARSCRGAHAGSPRLHFGFNRSLVIFFPALHHSCEVEDAAKMHLTGVEFSQPPNDVFWRAGKQELFRIWCEFFMRIQRVHCELVLFRSDELVEAPGCALRTR